MSQQSRFTNKEGQNVPEVVWPVIEGQTWKKVDSKSIFNGRKVVVFSLPGAFTPTCSSTHLPRYNQLAGVFKKLGVDEIVCISVNDTFVMNAWLDDQEAENITVIPDGNCEFTDKMGMLVGKQDLGFGDRSWRYSMFVNDGKIEKMFIEPDVDGDPFEVSDADTMLTYLAPEVAAPKEVAMFTKPGCPFCAKAKNMLTENGFEYTEMQLGRDTTLSAMKAVTGRDTVPQVFIGGEHIGGSDDLEKFFA